MVNGWDLLASLGHPCKFQRVSRLGSVTARHSNSGRQPNFVALNRGLHLYSAERPSRWALAHIASYSFIAADTLHDLVSLTFDLLTLASRHTWWVTWSIPPPSLKILRLSVLELWVLTSHIGSHSQCVCSHCACAVSRDLCVGANFLPIWKPWPRFAYSLYNFFGATITINGVTCQNSVWPCVKDHAALCALLLMHGNRGSTGS